MSHFIQLDDITRRFTSVPPLAERLAKRITDTLTIEKLLAFAGERRREIEVIAGRYRRA